MLVLINIYWRERLLSTLQSPYFASQSLRLTTPMSLSILSSPKTRSLMTRIRTMMIRNSTKSRRDRLRRQSLHLLSASLVDVADSIQRLLRRWRVRCRRL